MASTDKRKVLCAVRGQPASRTTVQRAIERTLDIEGELTFLLVIVTKPLTRAAPLKAPLRVVYQQLESLGEFAMTLLRDRAVNQGLDQVDYIVRRGKPAVTIREIVAQLKPDVIILGQPVPDERRAIFTPAEFDSFVELLRDESGAEIEVVETPLTDLPD